MVKSKRTDLVFTRTIFKTSKGTNIIFTPYDTWEGKEVYFSFLDKNYKTSEIAKKGKVTVSMKKYHDVYPDADNNIDGEKVLVWLKESEVTIKEQFGKKPK